MGLCRCTVHLDSPRYSMALRGSQDLCLVKKPQMAQGELSPQGPLTLICTHPPPAASQGTPSPCARKLAGESRVGQGQRCCIPFALRSWGDLEADLPGPLLSLPSLQWGAWAPVSPPVCPVRVCHLPAPWHNVFMHSAKNGAGCLCCCWVALQSPVYGNLLCTIAPGARQDLLFARLLPASRTDAFHPWAKARGIPVGISLNVFLSWRC